MGKARILFIAHKKLWAKRSGEDIVGSGGPFYVFLHSFMFRLWCKLLNGTQITADSQTGCLENSHRKAQKDTEGYKNHFRRYVVCESP